MFSFRILSIYLSRLYLRYFIAISAIFIFILLLANIFDILQKFKSFHLSSKYFWLLTIYKIPYLLNELSFLISFISMLFFIRKLVQKGELLAILSSGCPLWRILLPPLSVTIILGIIIITFLNPLSASFLKQYDNLVDRISHNNHNNEIIVSQLGIFVYEKYQNKDRIIQTKWLDINSKKLKDVVILLLDSSNKLLERIDSKEALVDHDKIYLHNPKVVVQNIPKNYANLEIPTSLSINDFVNNLVLPETISIWNLKEFIDRLYKSGIPALKYEIYYYKQLLKPLIMASTIFLATCFLNLNIRNNSQGKMLAAGLFAGFLVFFLMEMSIRTLSHNVQPFLSILLIVSLMIFISNFIIFHLHES